MTANIFHEKCDKQGPTITIIKSSNDMIFGGYTDKDWDISGDYKNSTKSFIFSLTKMTKHEIKNENKQYGIYCYTSYGPTWGGGHDINITGNGQSSYSNFGHTYETGDTVLHGNDGTNS